MSNEYDEDDSDVEVDLLRVATSCVHVVFEDELSDAQEFLRAAAARGRLGRDEVAEPTVESEKMAMREAEGAQEVAGAKRPPSILERATNKNRTDPYSQFVAVKSEEVKDKIREIERERDICEQSIQLWASMGLQKDADDAKIRAGELKMCLSVMKANMSANFKPMCKQLIDDRDRFLQFKSETASSGRMFEAARKRSEQRCDAQRDAIRRFVDDMFVFAEECISNCSSDRMGTTQSAAAVAVTGGPGAPSASSAASSADSVASAASAAFGDPSSAVYGALDEVGGAAAAAAAAAAADLHEDDDDLRSMLPTRQGTDLPHETAYLDSR